MIERFLSSSLRRIQTRKFQSARQCYCKETLPLRTCSHFEVAELNVIAISLAHCWCRHSTNFFLVHRQVSTCLRDIPLRPCRVNDEVESRVLKLSDWVTWYWTTCSLESSFMLTAEWNEVNGLAMQTIDLQDCRKKESEHSHTNVPMQLKQKIHFLIVLKP